MSTGTKLASEIVNNSTEPNKSENVISKPDIQFKFSEINVHEVALQLHNLKVSKSRGVDLIHIKIN